MQASKTDKDSKKVEFFGNSKTLINYDIDHQFSEFTFYIGTNKRCKLEDLQNGPEVKFTGKIYFFLF